MEDNTLCFEWTDKPEIGRYDCRLFEGDEEIDNISFSDYTCKWAQKSANECMIKRPCAFLASWHNGDVMYQGFDYDKEFQNRTDEKGRYVYGYNGTVTHTVDDVKAWCENWLAKRHISEYDAVLKNLDKIRRRAEWFTEHGYGKEKET